MEQPALDFVRHHAALRGLTDEQQHEVARWLQVSRVAVGGAVFRQGELGVSLFVVLDGMARIHLRDRHGEELVIGALHVGEMVGEIAALEPAPRTFSVMATSELLVAELTHNDLRLLERRSPPAAAKVLTWMASSSARRLRAINRELDKMVAQYAEAVPEPANQDDLVAEDDSLLGRLWSRLRPRRKIDVGEEGEP